MNDLTPLQFRRIRDHLASRCGIYLDESRSAQLMGAIGQRMESRGMLSVAAYEDLLHQPGELEELRTLAELLANHETFFFRNQPHFRALRQRVLPELNRRKPPGRPIRCWSAGCATGEEPYSLAICALEALGNPPARPIEIWATDISRKALERARDGCYRGRSLGHVSELQLSTYFKPSGGGYRLRPEVQSLISFQELNLLDPFPGWTIGLDMILCQNVTIYFQLATSKKLVEGFYGSLVEGGYLFLGFSETLWGIFDRFEMVEMDGAYAYRKSSPPVDQPLARPPRDLQSQRGQRQPRGAPQPPASGASAPSTGLKLPASGYPADNYQPATSSGARSAPVEDAVTAALERARALRSEGQQLAALDELKRLPPGSPQMPAILALVARLHADLGHWEQAAAEARRSLELDLLQEDAHLLLAVLGMRSSAWGDAVSHLERVRYLNPNDPLGSFYLAECYRQLGRREHALREYRNTLRKLEPLEPTLLIDGVAVGWLRVSCERWLEEPAQAPAKGRR